MTISNKNKKYKRSGSILASVMVAAIVWIMIAQSMFITFSGQFKMISSSRTALQAQQYAEIALDKLKNINYDELDVSGAHGRKKIEGISSDDWQDEVTIGAESTIAGSNDAKQRIATVNVYKVGDTLPRYTVELPLSSQGSNTIKGSPYGGWLQFPNGVILQWGICGWGYNSYNISFPNVALNVQLTAIGHNGEKWYNDYTYGVSNFDRNGFSVVGEVNSWTVCWMAIGY